MGLGSSPVPIFNGVVSARPKLTSVIVCVLDANSPPCGPPRGTRNLSWGENPRLREWRLKNSTTQSWTACALAVEMPLLHTDEELFRVLTGENRAETEGFEPSEPLRVLHLSRVVHSAGLCDVSMVVPKSTLAIIAGSRGQSDSGGLLVGEQAAL